MHHLLNVILIIDSTGAWFQNKKHGVGMYIYSNKDIYKGDWKMNIRHGVGTYFFAASLSQVLKLYHLKCFTLFTMNLI